MLFKGRGSRTGLEPLHGFGQYEIGVAALQADPSHGGWSVCAKAKITYVGSPNSAAGRAPAVMAYSVFARRVLRVYHGVAKGHVSYQSARRTTARPYLDLLKAIGRKEDGCQKSLSTIPG